MAWRTIILSSSVIISRPKHVILFQLSVFFLPTMHFAANRAYTVRCALLTTISLNVVIVVFYFSNLCVPSRCIVSLNPRSFFLCQLCLFFDQFCRSHRFILRFLRLYCSHSSWLWLGLKKRQMLLFFQVHKLHKRFEARVYCSGKLFLSYTQNLSRNDKRQLSSGIMKLLNNYRMNFSFTSWVLFSNLSTFSFYNIIITS